MTSALITSFMTSRLRLIRMTASKQARLFPLRDSTMVFSTRAPVKSYVEFVNQIYLKGL